MKLARQLFTVVYGIGRASTPVTIQNLYSMDGAFALSQMLPRWNGHATVYAAHATGECDAQGRGMASCCASI